MSRPEHWEVDAGDHDVAQLDIPPDSQRDRRFEISCSFSVALRSDRSDGAEDAWHAMTLRVDGVQAWSRRIATSPGGDSLDYRFRRTVEAGERLRLVATTQVKHAQRRRLVISAEEER
jgi:hypothetical protein